jgi:type III secretory pathway component EscT
VPSPVQLFTDAFARSAVDWAVDGLAWARAWARAMPSVVLVPAFGLRALPAPARAVMGLGFAASVVPALSPASVADAQAWPALLLAEAGRGLVVAIAAAIPLWAATMAGGVADALRGSPEGPSVPAVEGRPTPLGVPFSLLGSAIFLSAGGPARVVAALALRPLEESPLRAAANDLVGGITLAVALGGPLLAAAVVVELAGALVARAASPAQVHALIAPLRALSALAVLAVVFERFASALALSISAAP